MSFASAREIALGTDGINANMTLNKLIEHIVDGSVYCVTAVDPYGSQRYIFLHVLVYIGD